MMGSRTTFRHFFQKAALYSPLIPGFPVGEAVGFSRLKRSLHAFSPLPEKNSANFIFPAKMISLFHSLPLGGKVDKAELWTNEGRNPFLIEIFHRKYSIKGQFHLRKVIRSTLPFLSPFLHSLPFQSIPALTLSSLLYPGFRRSGSSRPLQSPFFILPALFKNHFSSQSFRSESLFSPEAQLLSHNFPQNAVLRATFFYFKCEHLFVFL